MKMSLEQMIIEDHNLLRDGMDALASTSIADVDERLELYPEIFSRLYAHEKSEQATIHSQMKMYDETKPLALVAEEQERVARILAVELKDTTLDDEIWLPKLLTLQGLLQQHMSFEEETIIPIAKQILDQGTMNRLGIDFEREQKEALKNAQVIYE
ncbi:hemerythrin domain-containing protein [Candidatus Methanomassiliicoccus intestinalis]|uniref:hemerythrin domain-containing protein n=1 Tax=Candidatus Methanomassiliicoccus intestinalis TaxID=1406512 RepID=UPI0037DC64BE